MAKSKNGKKKEADRFEPADVERHIAEINRQKESASEYQGLAGQATQAACEALGVEKKALTFVAGLAKKDAGKAQSILVDLMRLSHAAGLWDQLDMFSDAVPVLDAILDRVRSGGAPPADAEGAASELLQ